MNIHYFCNKNTEKKTKVVRRNFCFGGKLLEGLLSCTEVMGVRERGFGVTGQTEHPESGEMTLGFLSVDGKVLLDSEGAGREGRCGLASPALQGVCLHVPSLVNK